MLAFDFDTLGHVNMSRLLDTLVLVALLVAAPLAASAETYPECTSEPSEEEVEAAKGAFMAGKAAFDEADYDRSITYWNDAYRRDCTAHDLLQNLARAYELGGQKQAAIDALKTYLERVPDSPKREQFERRIEKLAQQLEEETLEPAEPVVEAPAPTPRPLSPTPTAPAPDAPIRPGHRPAGPLVLAGVAGGLALAGGIAYLSGTGKASDYEDECGTDRKNCPTDEVTKDAQDWRTRQTAYGITAWAGVAVAVGGLGWYLASPRRRASTALPDHENHGPVAFRPLAGPGFGGLAVRARF